MNATEREPIEKFFSEISPHEEAYQHSTFSYIAHRNDSAFIINHARLSLNPLRPKASRRFFETQNIKAGYYHIRDQNQSHRQIIESLIDGSIDTPQGRLLFPTNDGRSYHIFYNPFLSRGGDIRSRHRSLIVRGDRRVYGPSLVLDWELRSAAEPFDNQQELAMTFNLVVPQSDGIQFEAIAFEVAAIGDDSFVKGTKAKLTMHLAKGLERERSAIGLRMYVQGVVTERRRISSDDLKWTDSGEYQVGETDFDVPLGAFLHCYPSYAGKVESAYWLADDSLSQNPFRGIHQAFDPKFAALLELVSRAQTQPKGFQARELESAVAWLLWMLGFSTNQLGGTPLTSEAPDVIAVAPSGNMLVIECTTGILKSANKLAHLVERTERIRKMLNESGHQSMRVLPVIITTRTRDEVRAELDDARKLGIVVGTIETFQEVYKRTLIYPNANRLFDELEQTLHAASIQDHSLQST